LNKPARPLSKDPMDEFANIDEFRMMLLRRLKNQLAAWRQCPSRVCRRAKACADPDFPCTDKTAPPRDPEKAKRNLAYLYKKLERLVAEDEGEGGR
jgi:hypothetical protein